jgi:hypothetical protein
MTSDVLAELQEMARAVEKHAVPEIRACVNVWAKSLVYWSSKRAAKWPHRAVHILFVPPCMEHEVRAVDPDGAIRWVDAASVFDGLAPDDVVRPVNG